MLAGQDAPGHWRADRHNPDADGTRRKKTKVIFENVPADGHHGCQLEETRTSVRRRFLGSSSDKSVLTEPQMGVPEIKSNRSHPLLYRDAVWRTWSITTVLDRLRRSES